jgi:predicted nucleic acid-binding protein
MTFSKTSGADPLFLDTSALVRLYYLEPQDPFAWVVDLARRPEVQPAASHLAYVETLVAFHALRRRKAITARRQALLSAAFKRDWPSFLRVPLDYPVVFLAGVLAEDHPLRGADALQPTSFLLLWMRERRGRFLTLDPRPYRVARDLVPVGPVPALEVLSPSGQQHKEEP